MCGSKGDPLPPLSKEPLPPKGVGVFQDYRIPVVYWQAVLTFSDGRKIPVPEEVEYEIRVDFGKESFKANRTYFVDQRKIEPGERRCYSVRAIYAGVKGRSSETICIIGEKPPEGIPGLIEYKEGDGFFELKFKNHNLPIALFVNSSYPFLKPSSVLNKGENVYRTRAENGREYTIRYCFVRASVRGKLSSPIVLIPQDGVPPEPPRNPILIKEGRGCTLVWELSPSSDVKSYEIYWGKGKETVAGNSVYYRFIRCPKDVKIVAVDKSGNVSKPVKPEEVE